MSRGREKFPTGNLFVTESLTLRFDKIVMIYYSQRGTLTVVHKNMQKRTYINELSEKTGNCHCLWFR